jgi:hypothetical protein
MTNASIRMPAARPVASIFRNDSGAVDIARNASVRISAALVTSRPVRPMPFPSGRRMRRAAPLSSSGFFVVRLASSRMVREDVPGKPP